MYQMDEFIFSRTFLCVHMIIVIIVHVKAKNKSDKD